MTETYVVQNISPGPVSFSIFASYVIPEGTPKHKRRKMIKGAEQNIVIPPQQSRDLVKVTGLSIQELKGQPELNRILYNKETRLRLLDAVEPKVVEPKVVEPKVVEPKVVEPKVEEVPAGAPPPVIAPPVEGPKAEEPKKKTKTKKKKK